MPVSKQGGNVSNVAKRTPQGQNTYFGMYTGYVKDNTDAQKDGRLQVCIPELGGKDTDKSTWKTVAYCSPFGGITPQKQLGKDSQSSFNSSQTSYGMWFVPPDLDVKVAIMFEKGDPGRGYWFGCILEEQHNQMIPAIASSDNNHKYNGVDVPVSEYNKYTKDTVTWDKVKRPVHEQAFNGIADQGLINDHVRGLTTSSARRESPSQVYGISTPGPRNPNSKGNRLGGSKFVMDDGEGTEYIGLRTRTGAYFRIDETNGIIYMINKKGSAWLQLDDDGNVDIFSARSISLRAQEDVNIRADRNLNFEAGNDIQIKAAKDYTGSGAVSSPFSGSGGNIIVEANNKLDVTITSQAKFNFKDTLDIIVGVDGRIDVAKKLDITTTDTTHTSKNNTKFLAKNDFMITSNNNTDILADKTIRQMAMMDFNITGMTAINNQSLAISMLGGTSIRMTAPVISENGSPASPAQPALRSPPAVLPLKAALIPMNSKTNVLSSFSSKFKRDTHKVKSIVGRFMTYEPCPEHINKGTKNSFSKYQWSNASDAETFNIPPVKPVLYEEGKPVPEVQEGEIPVAVPMEDFKCGQWSTPTASKFGNPQEKYGNIMKQASETYGVPESIISRVAYQESRFNPNAYNKGSGASGMMQIVPRWHPSVRNPNDPNEAIPYGTKYLASLKKQFGTWDKALAAYNWGPGNLQKSISKHGEDWRNHLPKETSNYVTQIGSDVGLFGCPLEESPLKPPGTA